MQSIICNEPGGLSMSEEAEPTVKHGYSILKVRQIGICGTDFHAYAGNQPFFSYPRILGHEIAAEIFQTESTSFKVGELVTVSPYIYCGQCFACRSGKMNCCSSIRVMGVHCEGGLREYISVPNELIISGNDLGLDELSLIEPLAIGAHGVVRARVQPGETVMVIGAGPIGLATADFARVAGARVIMMDVDENRISYCKNVFDLKDVLNPKVEDCKQKLKLLTDGDMPSAIFDCTGNLSAIELAFPLIAHSGRFVLIGLQKNNISFNHPEFHKRETTLMSSRNALRVDFDHVINSLKLGLIKAENYITHRVQFSDLTESFEGLRNPDSVVIKALVSLD